jgi:hypothetical protein
LIEEFLPLICRWTDSRGATPDKTLNRELQEARDRGEIEFLSRGRYLLLGEDLPVEREELDEETLGAALMAGRLTFEYPVEDPDIAEDVATAETVAAARRRRGQEQLRRLTLDGYGLRCAACDVRDAKLLVASHVVRWSDEPRLRGRLTNVICLCRLHDALFEEGYWGLSDRYQVVVRPNVGSMSVKAFLREHTAFRVPRRFPPEPDYLAAHRRRCGLPRTIEA